MRLLTTIALAAVALFFLASLFAPGFGWLGWRGTGRMLAGEATASSAVPSPPGRTLRVSSSAPTAPAASEIPCRARLKTRKYAEST